MANNYYPATVSPELPASLFDESELRLLEGACGLSARQSGDMLFFCAEEGFCAQGEDEDGSVVDCTLLLQEKLRQLDAQTYPSITIHGASVCDKMRAGEFGGYAVRITREAIHSISTWEWLEQQEPGVQPSPAGSRPYSVLLLYPDYAGDYGSETFYAFVTAADPIAAVALAQRQAAAAQDGLDIDDPADFAPLLVTEGHHASQPLFNR